MDATPASLMQAPMGSTGPASPPTGNPGLMADAMSQVGVAIHILESVLPKLPVGSEPHEVVLGVITKLSKVAPAGEQSPQLQMTTLRGVAQDAQRSAPLMALMRQFAAQGGGGQGQAQPPPQPDMQAA